MVAYIKEKFEKGLVLVNPHGPSATAKSWSGNMRYTLDGEPVEQLTLAPGSAQVLLKERHNTEYGVLFNFNEDRFKDTWANDHLA